MRKIIVWYLVFALISISISASQSHLDEVIESLMKKYRGRPSVQEGANVILSWFKDAHEKGLGVDFGLSLMRVMEKNNSEFLLNAAIVTSLGKILSTITNKEYHSEVETMMFMGKLIVEKELEQYRSIQGLKGAYERFLPQDINRLLLNDFPNEAENAALVQYLKKVLDEDKKGPSYFKEFTPEEREGLNGFIGEYYEGLFKKAVQEILDSNIQDKQAALDKLYKEADLAGRAGYLESVLVASYKDELQRSASGVVFSAPVQDFCEGLMKQQNDRGLGSFSRRLGTVWVGVMQESELPMTEQGLIDTFNFLRTSLLEINALNMRNSVLRAIVCAVKAIGQLVNGKNLLESTDWIVNLGSTLSTNDVFNKFPRLWMVIAKNELDLAGEKQTDRVIAALNKSIPKERGWNKFKKNVKSWFGEYCSLHRLRLKRDAKKATDVDRYALAEGLITDRELTQGLRGVDKTPEELCLSIRVVLQSLQGDFVDGQPAKLLKALHGVSGVTLQMIQTEVIDRLPQSIRASFMQAIGQQQLDNSLSIDPSDAVDHDLASIFEGDGVPKKPSSAGSSIRGGGGSLSRSPVSVGSKGHLTVDTHGMAEEELREHLAENARVLQGSGEDYSGAPEGAYGK